MVFGNAKRIVVIKDIPSNLIEEAIFILKTDADSPRTSSIKNAVKVKKWDNRYLISEAQQVINSYIKESRSPTGEIKLNMKEICTSKKNTFVNMAINLTLAGSIVALIYLVVKVF